MSDGISVQLQTVVVTRLRETPAVTTLIPAASIFDRSQRPEHDLCIVVGEDQIIDEPTTLMDDGLRIYMTLHVWHRSQNFTLVKNISDAIRIAIRIPAPAIHDGRIARLKFQSARFMRDPGGDFVHGVITLNALVQLKLHDFDNEFNPEFDI